MQLPLISYDTPGMFFSHSSTVPASLPSSLTISSSNPFATGSTGAPHVHPSYPQISRQGTVPVNTNPSDNTQNPNWENINLVLGRLNDLLNGTSTAYTSFSSASTAWNDGRHIDALHDGYQGISGAMQALHGALVLASESARRNGHQAQATSLKEAAQYTNSAHRMLDSLLNPLSGFRDVAKAISDPSRTREQKLRAIADYFETMGQTMGLAIMQLDRRTGDTLLKQFGYAMFALADANHTLRQTITGYRQAVDALGSDPKTAVKATVETTNNLINGTQDLTEYLADTLNSAGLKNQAEEMFRISAELMNIRNLSNSIAIALDKTSKDR